MPLPVGDVDCAARFYRLAVDFDDLCAVLARDLVILVHGNQLGTPGKHRSRVIFGETVAGLDLFCAGLFVDVEYAYEHGCLVTAAIRRLEHVAELGIADERAGNVNRGPA